MSEQKNNSLKLKIPSINKKRHRDKDEDGWLSRSENKKVKTEESDDDNESIDTINRYRTPNYGKLILTEYHQIFRYDMKTAIHLHNKVHKGGFLNESFRLFSDLALGESPTVYMGSKFKTDLTEAFKPKFDYYKDFIKQIYPYIFSIGMFAYKYSWESEIDSYVPVLVPIESGSIVSVLDPSNPKKKYYWVWNKQRYNGINNTTSSSGGGDANLLNDIKGSLSMNNHGSVLYHDPDVVVHVMSAPRDLRDNTLEFLSMQLSEKSSSNDKAMACEMLQNQFTSDMSSIIIETTRYNKMMESQVEIETKKTKDNVYVETRIPFESDKFPKFLEMYKSDRGSIDDMASHEQLKELFDPYTSDIEKRQKNPRPYDPLPLNQTVYGGTLGQYMQRANTSEYSISNDGSVTASQNNSVPLYDVNNTHIHGSTGFDVPSSIYWQKKTQDAKITRTAIANANIDSHGIYGDPKMTPDGKMVVGGPLHTFKFAPTPSGGRSDLSDIVQMHNYQMSSLFGLPAVHSMSSNQTTARGRDIDKNVSESKISSILDTIKKIIEEILNSLYTNTQDIINVYRKNLLMASKKKLYQYLERELMNQGVDHNHLIVLKDDYSSELNTFEGNVYSDPFESLMTPEMIKTQKKSKEELIQLLTMGVFAENPDGLQKYQKELENLKYLSNDIHLKEESTIRIELKKKKEVDVIGMIESFKVGLVPKMDAAIEAMRQYNMDDSKSYKELVKMSETMDVKKSLKQFLDSQSSIDANIGGNMNNNNTGNGQDKNTPNKSSGNDSTSLDKLESEPKQPSKEKSTTNDDQPKK